jgi:hypothetical protein
VNWNQVPCKCNHRQVQHTISWNGVRVSSVCTICSCLKYKADNLKFLEQKSQEQEK